MNWYRPEHHIGLHADDETKMDLSVPIMSLSWGGPRRFLLRPKPHLMHKEELVSPVQEVLLQDGDLLIMGGKCQEEFKHEIPKLRKKDGLVVDRISWTIRCVKPSLQGSKMKRKTDSKQQNDSTARVKRKKGLVKCLN
jgi:alkylated DNA repair dioxygenase AlkB